MQLLPVTTKACFTDKEVEILSQAEKILKTSFNLHQYKDQITSVAAIKKYIRIRLGSRNQEVFGIIFLSNQHYIIDYKELFIGSIASSMVCPREVIKHVLSLEANAVILVHNHPSGDVTPSGLDKEITQRIKTVLNAINVSLLDHVIVGETMFSFAENNLI